MDWLRQRTNDGQEALHVYKPIFPIYLIAEEPGLHRTRQIHSPSTIALRCDPTPHALLDSGHYSAHVDDISPTRTPPPTEARDPMI